MFYYKAQGCDTLKIISKYFLVEPLKINWRYEFYLENYVVYQNCLNGRLDDQDVHTENKLLLRFYVTITTLYMVFSINHHKNLLSLIYPLKSTYI